MTGENMSRLGYSDSSQIKVQPIRIMIVRMIWDSTVQNKTFKTVIQA